MKTLRLLLIFSTIMLSLACSEKDETQPQQKDLNSYKYEPTETGQDGFLATDFSKDWKRILIFKRENISPEQWKYLSDIGLCVQIDVNDKKILTGLYVTEDNDFGGFIARIDRSTNKIEQVNPIYHKQKNLIVLRQNPTNFYLGNHFETEFDSQVSYENIEKLDAIPE